ncbi:hypothetical protein MNBD_GAMMA05-2302 [hydrothermal vent metagenome]|uniref:Uncharacterized protein n=1 Tax=hydrothermal vent metagenome TaxID=652676 RepID=A0A3B0WTS1_9ZZZZ
MEINKTLQPGDMGTKWLAEKKYDNLLMMKLKNLG